MQVDVQSNDARSNDLFRQVNNTMYDIQKSKSQTSLKICDELQRTESKTDISKEESSKQQEKKDIIGAVKDKVTNGINKVKDNLTLKKNKKESDTKKAEKKPEDSKPKENVDTKPSYQESMEQRRKENKEMMERMKMSKVF